MKLLRRRTFCRQEDFERKLRPQAMAAGYHRATWAPISIRTIAESVTFKILKAEQWDWSEFYSRREMYEYVEYQPFRTETADILLARQYLSYIKQHQMLYDPKWTDWSWNFENDRIWLRYFSNKSWKILGVAILERDY